jgi:hypothetical protein
MTSFRICPTGTKTGSAKEDTPKGGANDTLLSPEEYSHGEAYVGAYEVCAITFRPKIIVCVLFAVVAP